MNEEIASSICTALWFIEIILGILTIIKILAYLENNRQSKQIKKLKKEKEDLNSKLIEKDEKIYNLQELIEEKKEK